MRYALDVFTGTTGLKRSAFLSLAEYYAQRGELEAFATCVVEAVRDDARLQKSKVLDQVLESLAGVANACQSVARAISAPRSDDDYGRCGVALKAHLLTHIRTAGPVYRDDQARRRALIFLGKGDVALETVEATPAYSTPRVIPGFVLSGPRNAP